MKQQPSHPRVKEQMSHFPIAWLPAWRPDLHAALAIAALAYLAFGNSLWNGFVFDDVAIIQENRAIRRPSNLRAIFGAGYWPGPVIEELHYRPLLIFSYALNYAVAGLRPFTYHLVNVLLHAGNSALVYCLFVALFKARGVALAGAAAFALHPIHTEAVANTVGRAELLSNAFVLLSWWWYLKWDDAPARAKARWLAASLAAFTLALFTKEHVIVLPGFLVLTDLFRASERGLPLARTLREKCRTAYAWYLPPLAGYLLVRFLVLGEVLSSRISWLANPVAHADLWTRVLTSIKVLGHFLWLLLVPLRLSSDYYYNQIPVSRSIFEPAVLVALMAFLAAVGLAVWSWRRRPIISMGVGIFAIAILPVSSLLFPIGTIMAERVLYLPSLGFCLLVAALVTTLAARPRWRVLAVGGFALLLFGYGARTVLRNRDWRSNVTLFVAAARASPNSATAHAALGNILFERGDLSGARREFERSLEIYPGYGTALVRLGRVLERQGRIDEAVQVYRQVGREKRLYGLAQLNLAFIALRQGRPEEALLEFREVAALGSLGAQEANELAEGLFKLGYVTDAQTVLERARQDAPDVFYLRENLARVYWRQGRAEDAQRELEAATRLKSDSR